jgi:hypothetical protein
MSEPSPRFFYRVLPNGTGWYWEIVDSEDIVIERGIASERVRAYADALRTAMTRLAAIPEAYPEGRELPQ